MTTPASRRNGKPASCEPCRRAKIRCDHGQPVCGRCQYRGMTAKCFYHPAPLTKPRPSGSVGLGRESRPLTPINDPGIQQTYTAITRTDEAVQYALRAGNDSDVRRSQFQDSEVNVRRQVDEIIDLLEPLRDLEEIQRLIAHYTSTAQVGLVPAPIMLYATSTLFESARELSLRQASEDVGAVRDFAAAILRNTSSSVLVHPNMEYKPFVDMFTGGNLRVEMLGVIYTVAARSRVYTMSRKVDNVNQLLHQLFKAGQACLNLARELAPTVNDVMIWLSFEITRLYTNAQGDAHPNVWRSMGDTISDAYIMEIHREAKLTYNTPFWLVECRRKNWAIIYHWDKVVAIYFQRPPRIAKRYSNCELPLDLTDEELLGSPTTLSSARSKLTPEGWNPEGAYCSTTWYRLRCTASKLLEDQWEYKDRKLNPEDIKDLEQLAGECQMVRASFPDSLQYHPEMWNSGMKPSACLMLAIIHLMYLHNDLQLHLMLMRNDSAYMGTTLHLAFQIVSTVNHFGQVRERDMFLQHDNAYVLLCFGLPAASILVPALSESRDLPADISRSKLIRDLSLFIGYLEKICKRGDPNYTVCIQAARIFSRALDEILDPKRTCMTQQQQQQQQEMLSESTNLGLGDGDVPLPAAAAAAAAAALPFSVAEQEGPGNILQSTVVDDDQEMDLGMLDGLDQFDLESWMQSVDWSSIGGEHTF